MFCAASIFTLVVCVEFLKFWLVTEFITSRLLSGGLSFVKVSVS